MATGILNTSSNNRSFGLAGFLTNAVVCFVAVVGTSELHESIHLLVGRLAGLPAHFLGLTSVGVTSAVAAVSAPIDLALMNGVAPLATMVLGLVALAAVPALRRSAPVAVTQFVAWCAIVGVPYIGLQTMLTAAPIRLRGDGADSAAVIGGYFGLSAGARALISLVGLVLYLASGFWLRRAVSDTDDTARGSVTAGRRLKGLPVWRIIAASILGLVVVALAVRSTVLLMNGNSRGILLLVDGPPFAWAGMMAFLVSWRTPKALNVRDGWIFPGMLACVFLIALGVLSHTDDYSLIGEILLLPLITSAW